VWQATEPVIGIHGEIDRRSLDDPNVTDKKFPGNPTRSYRSREPLKIIGEVTDWTRQTPAGLQAWRDRLAAIRADERGEIIN
jgi:rifampin ADP-ribosylating transferase